MVLVRTTADVMVYALPFTVFVEAISEREYETDACRNSSENYIFRPTQSHSG